MNFIQAQIICKFTLESSLNNKLFIHQTILVSVGPCQYLPSVIFSSHSVMKLLSAVAMAAAVCQMV